MRLLRSQDHGGALKNRENKRKRYATTFNNMSGYHYQRQETFSMSMLPLVASTAASIILAGGVFAASKDEVRHKGAMPTLHI